MNITIKNTEPCEAEALANIQKAAFMPLYEKYHDEGSPALRGADELLSRMTPNYRVFTILCDGEMVGGIFYRLHGKYTPDNFLSEGEYYLCRIWIAPKYQNKGIAAAAILLCEREFPDARRFFVDFPIDMEKNKRCYQKVGFGDTGERRPGGEGLTLALYKKEVTHDQTQFPALPMIYPVKADELPACLHVIHQSFATVAKQFGLTRENCPKHTSFLPLSYLETQLGWGWHMFGLFAGKALIGYVSLSAEGDVYTLHNLAVLPEYRHHGFGKQLLDYAKAHAKALGGSVIKIGIIDESTVLKEWYAANGFVHTGSHKFEHLPFTTSYMEYNIRKETET